MKTAFDTKRTGSGTKEWSESSVNIGRGCSHSCLYCYAKGIALRVGQIENHGEWAIETINQKAVNKGYGKRNGVVMFPTSHDISMRYLHSSIEVLQKLLKAGNEVLIVSKPNPVCIRILCDILKEYKPQILFRFTITSRSKYLSNFWEPEASLPMDRFKALKHAFREGYRTSVSIEPMLAGALDAFSVVDLIDTYVTDTIWIGKMNKVRLRVDMSKEENRLAVEEIERLQCDDEILRLYQNLKHNPKVRWKDSIRQVIEKHGAL